jgi:hypothetical protein
VIGGELGLMHGRDLLHDQAAGVVDSPHQVARVVQSERDDSRGQLEGELEPLGIEGRHDVVQGVRPVGGVPKFVDLTA